MSKLSVIIPARYELYLQQTLTDLLAKATGDIEIIVILDGYWPQQVIIDDPRQIILHRSRRGMRASINSAISIAKGKFIMKVDAHCMFSPGYDEVLKNNCEDNWVVIPRRYSLDVDNWCVKTGKSFVDYEYLSYPYGPSRYIHGEKHGLHARIWTDRTQKRIDKLIDENMTFQGSCWFTTKEHFIKRIGLLQEEGYGTFIGEPQEIGLKTWLGEGKVMTNKIAWYAHLWKGKVYRQKFQELLGFPYTRIGLSELKTGNKFSTQYWMSNQWEKRKHDIAWLIERFWQVPSWSEDREEWTHSTIS